MKYKMIVLDLDGTLTNEQKKITPKTKEALMRAQENGIKVVLASALADELELKKYDGYILAFNGGKIISCKDMSVVFEQILDENLVPKLYESAVNNNMPILTYQGEDIATNHKDDQYVAYEAFINQMPVVQYDDFLGQIVYPINKCLIVGEEVEGKMNVYRSATCFLECVPLGIDKAKSLDRLIKTLDIKREEIIACGDGYNDLSMIEFAGLGVAMSNAAEDIQEKADFITLSNEEDGVAHVINKFIFNE